MRVSRRLVRVVSWMARARCPATCGVMLLLVGVSRVCCNLRGDRMRIGQLTWVGLALSTSTMMGCCGNDALPGKPTGGAATFSPRHAVDALHFARTADEYEEDFPVKPALELSEWLSAYESGENVGNQERLAQAEAEWRKLRQGGRTLWRSEEWMKQPDYYRGLSTTELAEECFSRAVIAHELMIFDDPALGLCRARVFHDGFAVLMRRQDVVDGLIHAFDIHSSTIADPSASLEQRVHSAATLEAICVMCHLSPVREELKGREGDLLSCLVTVLTRFRTHLDAWGAHDQPGRSLGCFREPASVAMVSLICLKQTDPEHFKEVAELVSRVRFPREQRSQDLGAYLSLVLGCLQAGDRGGSD